MVASVLSHFCHSTTLFFFSSSHFKNRKLQSVLSSLKFFALLVHGPPVAPNYFACRLLAALLGCCINTVVNFVLCMSKVWQLNASTRGN